MIPVISKLFNLPVTRKEVLLRAKELQKAGICDSIYAALDDYSIPRTSLHVYFPKFIRQNALNFVGSKNSLWWWEYDVWDTGRMDFLNWLIGQYKDDKTNLRKL